MSVNDLLTIGFTSTRKLREKDPPRIRGVLDTLDADRYVTGGAIGGDALIGLYLVLTQPSKEHIVYVPHNTSQVEWWWETEAARATGAVINVFHGGSYAERNQKIVDAINKLYAFPGYPEQDGHSRRSGTWETIRMAKKRPIDKHICVLREDSW